MQQTAKKHATHAFSQFRLTNKTVNNLSQFNLTPTAKLVLVYLTTCYNPKKADMFPKQKTIVIKLGISEASVIRAISELHKEGLIISERKYTLRYKFTSKIVSKLPEIEKFFEPDNLQENNPQNESSETCNLQPHDIEPMREHKKEPLKVEDYKILKKYALKYCNKNLQGYINKLINSGSAERIIKDYKQMQANAQGMVAKAKKVQEDLAFARANRAENVPSDFFENVRLNVLRRKQASRG